MTSTKNGATGMPGGKALDELPVYVTMRFADTFTSTEFDILGVALNDDVAVSRLLDFMCVQGQTLTFTELDEVDLTVWRNDHWGSIEKGEWHVSSDRRLWIGCAERIEIAKRDALASLQGEL